MKCEKSSILETENFDKNWNFQEIFKIFSLFQFKIIEILESDNYVWK